MKKEISLITPVSKDLLYVKIADAIHSYIQENNLKSGDRLPSERKLAEQLGAGRHSIREALRVLENQGIIEVRMGAGTFVAEPVHNDSMYMEFLKINYIELLGVKTELEKYAVALAMHRLSIEDIARLEEHLWNIKEYTKENNRFFFDEDKKFHSLLINKSGNKMLKQMIWTMIETFDTYYGVIPQSDELCIMTIPYHEQILNSIRKKDMEGIREAYDRILELDARLVQNKDR